jgi:hypothetical protein
VWEFYYYRSDHVWVWEFYYSRSEFKDLEILMQQENSFQRFTVSFIVLMLSFSYNYKVCLYPKEELKSWN